MHTDLPPWATTERQDQIAGVTDGKAWDWHDELIAAMAVQSQREKQAKEQREREDNERISCAVRTVEDIGLWSFIRLYLSVRWECWWWGIRLEDLKIDDVRLPTTPQAQRLRARVWLTECHPRLRPVDLMDSRPRGALRSPAPSPRPLQGQRC